MNPVWLSHTGFFLGWFLLGCNYHVIARSEATWQSPEAGQSSELVGGVMTPPYRNKNPLWFVHSGFFDINACG